MAAGIMRVRGAASLQTAHGVYPLPFDFAASMDEVFPPATIEVADATTDQALIVLGMGGLTTIQGLVIVSNVAISVKLGVAGSNVALVREAHAPLIIMGLSLTAVSVSNASGGTAIVTYMVAGT